MAKKAVSLRDATSVTPGQMSEFWNRVKCGRMNKYIMKCILDGKNPSEIPEDPIERMTVFWKQFFDWEIDWKNVRIPQETYIPGHELEFNWLLVMPIGLTYDMVVEVIQLLLSFKSHSRFKISEIIDFTMESRQTTKTYAILLRETVTADEIHGNKSVNMIIEEQVKGVTLLERMVLEIFFWWMSGHKKNLDPFSRTLCTGSRYCDGSVPTVSYSVGYKNVNIYSEDIDSRDNTLCTREVIVA